MTETTTRTPVS